MKDLQGKNALVTGASYGIGPTIATALARKGVNLALVARSTEKLQQVADEMAGLGVKVVPIPADICDAEARQWLVSQAETELGPLDILVNNAAVHHAGSLHKRSAAEIEAVLTTTLLAPILLTRQLLPGMLARKCGHFVHITSLAGKLGLSYFPVYTAAKYALTGFNHSLQAELRGTGVFSSAVAPGFLRDSGMWARLKRQVHPAFGLSSPEQVAAAVLHALQKQEVEVIVNPMPVRPVILLWALWPGLALRAFRLLQVDTFLANAAQQVEEEELKDSIVAGAAIVQPAR